MAKRKNNNQKIQSYRLKRGRKAVGYLRTELVSGILVDIYSKKPDGPASKKPIVHDQRVSIQPENPRIKHAGLTADKYFSEEEIVKLYAAAEARMKTNRGRTTHFILKMLLSTGLRASELCTLCIDHTPVVLGVDELRVLGKGNKIRPVPILSELSDYIRWYVKKVRPSYVRRPMKKTDLSNPLILGESGKAYTRQLLYKRIHCLGIVAGLDKKTGVHRCRHSFGTHAYRSGMDLVTLQNIMGHDDINTTTIYAKADQSKTREMLRKVFTLRAKNSIHCQD